VESWNQFNYIENTKETLSFLGRGFFLIDKGFDKGFF